MGLKGGGGWFRLVVRSWDGEEGGASVGRIHRICPARAGGVQSLPRGLDGVGFPDGHDAILRECE
jgi:hypothetical protein